MVDVKIPRAASASCYIDRRTCGRARPANKSRSLGKDTPVRLSVAQWTAPVEVYLANAASTPSFRH